MARIVGAIALSHTPTIGFAVDQKKQDDPQWAPIFEAFAEPKAWMEAQEADALVVIYNDHVSSFFFDHYSAFALGVGERYACADEGGGARALPNLNGQAKLAAHIGQSLMAEEFDLSFFQGKALDHGIFSPLSMLFGEAEHHPHNWSIPIVPLQVGVLQFPMPSAKRCLALGRAMRRAIESFPDDLKVIVVATGGLSHQVHGERAGFNNTAWDHQFLGLIESDPDKLAQLTQAELAQLGGMEGAEVIMWLIMRGALSAAIEKRFERYYLPSMTGIAAVVYENRASATVAGETQRIRDLQALQLKGAETLSGSYPYTIERSVKAYRLNRYLRAMADAQHRALFVQNEEQSYAQAQLSEPEKMLLRARDWRGLIHYGVIFFVLEKWAAVLGLSNLHVYAAMRGESFEQFKASRNAPNAVYSVASAINQ